MPQTQVWLAMLEHRSHFILFHYTTLHYITLIIYSAAKSIRGSIRSETLFTTIPINRRQRILYSHLEPLSEHALSYFEVPIDCV